MSDSFSETQTATELGSEAGASAVTESPNPDAPPPRPKPTKLYSWRARNPDVELLYIRDVDIANLELDRMSTLSAVGFDQEWRPTFIKGLPENPVSLIQLASDDLVLLLQVSAMNEIPEKLIQILENPDIVKAGVGIQGDVHKLYKDHKVDVKNCVDLSLLARSVDNPRWKGKYSSSIGLSRLIEEYEDETLQKGRITRSNWEAVLSTAQQIYAANDAHAGLTLYNHLGTMARATDTLKPVYYTFDCVRGRLCEPSGAQWYAWNPNYDPGPPPPPRPPKLPKIKELPSATNNTIITSPSPSTLSSSSPSSAHPISGPSSTNTTIVSTNTNSHTPTNVNNFTKASRSGGYGTHYYNNRAQNSFRSYPNSSSGNSNAPYLPRHQRLGTVAPQGEVMPIPVQHNICSNRSDDRGHAPYPPTPRRFEERGRRGRGRGRGQARTQVPHSLPDT
ncbi:ribonuclease H-like protein [Pleurotus eryngii]|uniref:Ribonuclease H-like protein n=1 Tax=Pleurotus eryngii TaxID=5323 RepID=A0A9P6DHJ8_PLEER|nr:ribonuclease H-like protein [Pleurotus eryngii]